MDSLRNSSEPIPSIVLPIVRKASERINSNNDIDPFQSFTSLSPSFVSQLSTSSTSSQLLTPSLSIQSSTSITPGNQIKLNTRLNGKHSSNWKMSKSDKFSKVIIFLFH